jgi:hypothetical protein
VLGFNCATVRFCLTDPLLVIPAGLVLLLCLGGVAVGWHRRSSAGARLWLERLVLVVLGLRLTSNWVYEQGNPWWFMSLLPAVLAVIVLALTFPFSLGLALTATVRVRTDVWRRLGRMVLILLLVPALHLLISDSGVWPTRVTLEHMTVIFHRHRPVFDRIAAKYEDALPPECQPVCRDGRRAPVPFDPELLLLHAWLGTDAGYWHVDGTLHLKWWCIGFFDGVCTGYTYSPHKALAPWGYSSQHLGGDWYLTGR